MLLDRTIDDINAVAPASAIATTLRHWLFGHAEPPEHDDVAKCLAIMAADLVLFKPSMSGRTSVDRHLNGSRPEAHVERQAVEALVAAQFRLVRIVGNAAVPPACPAHVASNSLSNLAHP
jgi:hypothetical protein